MRRVVMGIAVFTVACLGFCCGKLSWLGKKYNTFEDALEC